MTTTDTQTVNAYQLVTLAHGLALEISHPGMKLTNKAPGLTTVAKRLGYTGKASKIDALLWAVTIMVNNDLTISSNILKALNENGYELYIDDDRQQFIDSY
jgi:hypothetical protein